jgi:hypothetical protein
MLAIGPRPLEAADHDMGCQEKYTPFRMVAEDSALDCT